MPGKKTIGNVGAGRVRRPNRQPEDDVPGALLYEAESPYRHLSVFVQDAQRRNGSVMLHIRETAHGETRQLQMLPMELCEATAELLLCAGDHGLHVGNLREPLTDSLRGF